MDGKYPHWYHDEMEECCNHMDQPMMHQECMPPKAYAAYPDNSFKDRLLCMLGTDVIFSVDARICRQDSFCGTLCHVGCDFIIVNVCMRHKPLSMMVPIKMLRFIGPKSHC
jgi:hypothetical protein